MNEETKQEIVKYMTQVPNHEKERKDLGGKIHILQAHVEENLEVTPLVVTPSTTTIIDIVMKELVTTP